MIYITFTDVNKHIWACNVGVVVTVVVVMVLYVYIHTYACRRVYVYMTVQVYAVLVKIYTTMKSVSAKVLTNVAHSLETL